MIAESHRGGERPSLLRSSISRGTGSMSRRKSLSLRSLFFAVADDFRSDAAAGDWMCPACCYQNSDPCNPVCSLCGLNREEDDTEDFPNSNVELHETVLPGKGTKGGSPETLGSNPAHSMRKIGRALNEEGGNYAHRVGSSIDSDFNNYDAEKMSQLATTSAARPITGLPQKPDILSPANAKKSTTQLAKKQVSFANVLATYADKDEEWVCGLCTYVNDDPLHLTCAVCGNKRGHQNSTELPEEESFQLGTCEEEQSFYLEQERLRSEERDAWVIENARMEEMIAFQSEILEDLQRDRDIIVASSSDEEHALENAHRELAQCEVILKTMTSLHSDEMMEQQMMEAVQQQRRETIESEEGPSAFEALREEGRPSLSKMGNSKRTLVWTAQQRMLHDWKEHLQTQQLQIEEMRQLHNELSESFSWFPSEESIRSLQGLP